MLTPYNSKLKITKFCKCVFDCYDEHKVNGHIARPNGDKNA